MTAVVRKFKERLNVFFDSKRSFVNVIKVNTDKSFQQPQQNFKKKN